MHFFSEIKEIAESAARGMSEGKNSIKGKSKP